MISQTLRFSLQGRDFNMMWVAGCLATEGRIAEIYNLRAFDAAASAMMGIQTAGNAYSYPPHALFIAMPFAYLPLGLAFASWNVLTLGLFLYAARFHLPERLWLAGCAPASVICLSFGQYGLLTSALFLLAFRRSVLGGSGADD
ncbi:glycosyltransferase 87 family protein [Sphingomonas arenae]|uniref:glycosyltransferase 87 family protein n=1 Tax=Sphingomonas arenae TaxID=2812555 RepID=UPI001968152D